MMLANKVAIVTGSTKGIGFAIAKRLGLAGASVVISSRREKNVSSALDDLKKQNIKAIGMTCHVMNEEHRKNLIKETLKSFGKIDILVSNVAVSPYMGPTMNITEEQIDKILNLNLKSAFFLARDCYPYLKKTKGNIIFVSSIAAYQNMSGIGFYSISKTALIGLTKLLANELAADEIRVNCVAPGVIRTDFSKILVETDSIREPMLEMVPLKRLGEPEDCSGAVLFLSSDEMAGYVTGECIVIAGGMQSRL